MRDGHTRTEPGQPNAADAAGLALLFAATHAQAMKESGVQLEEIQQLILASSGPDEFVERAHKLLQERLALNGVHGDLHHA